MKSIGIVRKFDHLGRVVFPVELRQMLGIGRGDPLEILVDDKMIVLRKYYAGCLFCGNMEGLTDIKGKKVCGDCLREVKEFAD
ncbi:MAG: AbrB/MazE/SpoVT family DNA-binding domain-containing protein [Bacteroidota bacterium]